ncbi:MAG: hypothetical protein ACI84R_000935 [Candidatus Azotimanducaceae bacterium]|jgi:hypothetical protein
MAGLGRPVNRFSSSPKTLVFGTGSNQPNLNRQKPRSKLNQLMKVFGNLMIAAIRARRSIGHNGLTAAFRSAAPTPDP